MQCVIDEYTRECLAIGVVFSEQSQSRLSELRGLPQSITIEDGPEFAVKVSMPGPMHTD